MKSLQFNSEESWLEARKGKITGTRLKDIISKRGGDKKIGYYEILAERVAIPANGENVMDRGHRLEDDALVRFATETGKKVKNKLTMWVREDDLDIAISPDGEISPTEAVECKCLSSARHIEALLTNRIPSEYEYQVLQYFIVNDKLKKLYFVFYDPRMPKDFFYIEVNRKDKMVEIKDYLEIERQTLKELALDEEKLTFK